MKRRDLNQEDVAPALNNRHRSKVSRILKKKQELDFDEIEPLAKILHVAPLELLRRAHAWSPEFAAALEAAEIASSLDRDTLDIWIAIGKKLRAVVNSPGEHDHPLRFAAS